MSLPAGLIAYGNEQREKRSGRTETQEMPNRHVLKGTGKEIQGDLKSRWGKPIDEDGRRSSGTGKSIGILQKRYG